MQPSYVWPPTQHRDQSSSGSGVSVGPSPIADAGSLKPVDLGNNYPSDIVGMNNMPINASSDELIRALQSQTAFVEGDPSTDEDLELYYYRFVRISRVLFPALVFNANCAPKNCQSGSTAIQYVGPSTPLEHL